MVEKNYFLLFMVLTFAFFIRLFASVAVPFTMDEEEKIPVAKAISFDITKLNLLMGDHIVKNPLLSAYILKAGFAIFGEREFGGRFFFVLLSTLSLYAIFKLVEETLGRSQALLALVLLTFSQFHIGNSRIVDEDGLLMAISSFAMLFFFKLLSTQKKRFMYLTCITLGLAYLSKEPALILIIVIFIFIITNRNYRFLFLQKDAYIGIFLLLLVIFPHLWWSFHNEFYGYTSKEVSNLGVSLRPLYMYIGEIIAWLAERLPFVVWDYSKEAIYIALPNGDQKLLSFVSNEFPFVNWLLGSFILAAYIYCIKTESRKNELIRFCLIMFGFVFIVTAVVAGKRSLLDQHWWGSPSFVPGVILCSEMLTRLSKRKNYFKYMTIALVIYLIINAFYFIRIPESLFAVPRNELCKYYLERVNVYLKRGEIGKAIVRAKWIVKKCNNEDIVEKAKAIASYVSN